MRAHDRQAPRAPPSRQLSSAVCVLRTSGVPNGAKRWVVWKYPDQAPLLATYRAHHEFQRNDRLSPAPAPGMCVSSDTTSGYEMSTASATNQAAAASVHRCGASGGRCWALAIVRPRTAECRSSPRTSGSRAARASSARRRAAIRSRSGMPDVRVVAQDHRHGVGRVGRVRRLELVVPHLLGVAVIGGDDRACRRPASSVGHDPPEAAGPAFRRPRSRRRAGRCGRPCRRWRSCR